MPNLIEDAAWEHIRERSPGSLKALYKAMVSGKLLVPLSGEIDKGSPGQARLPVRCVRLSNGAGCVPAFTSVGRLLEWKSEGSKYAELTGPALFDMVTRMPEVDCVIINYSKQKGTPKGRVNRGEFELLAKGILPDVEK